MALNIERRTVLPLGRASAFLILLTADVTYKVSYTSTDGVAIVPVGGPRSGEPTLRPLNKNVSASSYGNDIRLSGVV